MRAKLIFLLLAACGSSAPCGPDSATVERVIDGDTIVLTNGTRIRYLLINAPETTLGHHDCYGEEATDLNRALVDRRTVSLTYDVRCLDKYGRTLAFITSGGTDVNRVLVDRGMACEEFIPPDGEARQDEFHDAEAVAKANRIGMWGACPTVTCER
jgi:micrococcal nuclease